MKGKRRLKIKKFKFHPITTFIILIFFTMILSGIFSVLEIQGSYSRINSTTGQLESVLVTVENLLNYDGLKFLISEATKNFVSFTPLSNLLIAIFGVSVAYGTGLLDTFIKRYMVKLDNKKITFFLILLATISSLINDVGYVILIPLSAILYMANGRNPLTGIVAAFCGVSFGYGATVFVGSMEVNLIPYTKQAAALIDPSAHISLTSNLFIIMVTSIILSIVGTIVIEKTVVPKLGKYREKNALGKTIELDITDLEAEEQKKLETEIREKKGLRNAFIVSCIMLVFLIYSLIPGYPLSGLLLDTNANTYLAQVFGDKAYFYDGFTYVVSIFFIIAGIAYGIGAKTIKNDRDVYNLASDYLKEIGGVLSLIFFAAQFIAVFRKSNIGTIFLAWGTTLINDLSFSGIPLIILVLLVTAFVNLFATTPALKWNILAPVVVPTLMQSNISPPFAQFLLRAGDSMTKGITPLLAYFVIYVGYLNIYNRNKDNPVTIKQSIELITPYCLVISLTWIAICVGWYLIGLPIGPGVYPTA